MEEIGEGRQKVQISGEVSSGNVMYCLMTIVKNTVLYILKVLRQ